MSRYPLDGKIACRITRHSHSMKGWLRCNWSINGAWSTITTLIFQLTVRQPTRSYSYFPSRIFTITKYPRLLLCRKWLLISNYSSTRRGLIWFLLASSTKRVPIAKHVISFRTRFFLSQNFRIIKLSFSCPGWGIHTWVPYKLER